MCYGLVIALPSVNSASTDRSLLHYSSTYGSTTSSGTPLETPLPCKPRHAPATSTTFSPRTKSCPVRLSALSSSNMTACNRTRLKCWSKLHTYPSTHPRILWVARSTTRTRLRVACMRRRNSRGPPCRARICSRTRRGAGVRVTLVLAGIAGTAVARVCRVKIRNGAESALAHADMLSSGRALRNTVASRTVGSTAMMVSRGAVSAYALSKCSSNGFKHESREERALCSPSVIVAHGAGRWRRDADDGPLVDRAYG